MDTKKRIGVIMGGPSAEREVSLRTGAGVLAALEKRGHDAVAIDWTPDRSLAEHLRSERVQIAWIALHGTLGEDGCVQGLLECERIPYTGSGVLASALGMDKTASKRMFDQFAIASPPWAIYRSQADVESIGLPLVVKPSREGSSVGVSIVRESAELAPALGAAQKCHGEVLIEKCIDGRDVQVAVLDDAVLGTVEVRAAGKFYDYEAKYQRTDTQYLVPAPLDPITDEKARDLALRAHRAIGAAGATRTDLMIGQDGRVWVLEVNTLPGMTATSLLPKIARHAGLSYEDLVERILASARLRA
jgi:D-alanine-D-alanine ligase